ncbi:hypothetical protein I316_01853 [Kwoniella heveanensis BCC8398]|uniref:Uncharacterized protein n=1 Tax=Kwoniella heveanensis BCC8398 TaxID=1296120 RepID=A0A1B9H000_9TREE|nr:hypothetical protein I316_01853 [Kwoniella heveanensis BCC8398]
MPPRHDAIHQNAALRQAAMDPPPPPAGPVGSPIALTSAAATGSSGAQIVDKNLSGVQLIVDIQKGFDSLAKISDRPELAGYRPGTVTKKRRAEAKAAEKKNNPPKLPKTVNDQIAAIIAGTQVELSNSPPKLAEFKRVLAQYRGRLFLRAQKDVWRRRRAAEISGELDEIISQLEEIGDVLLAHRMLALSPGVRQPGTQ